MRAYLVKDDGTLEMISVAYVSGRFYTRTGVPLSPTGHRRHLEGWPDRLVDEYTSGHVYYWVPA